MTLFIELTHENNPENNKLISKLKIVYPYIQIMFGNERNRVLILVHCGRNSKALN